MTNEIIKINNETSVELIPAQIKINGFSKLEEYVKNSVDEANKLIITADTFKGDKKKRAELNKEAEAVKRVRIDIQNKILEPYKDFANQMKDFENSIKNSSSKINTGINFYVEKERQSKKDSIKKFILEASPNYGCDPNEIEIDDKWLNSSTSKKTWEEAVVAQMLTIQKQKAKRLKDEEQINFSAKLLGVDPTPYINLLNHNVDVFEIQKNMQTDIERQKAKQAERKATEKIVKDKVIDTNTGEVKDNVETFTLKLTGTSKQLKALRRYLDNSGIKFESLGD